MSSLYQLYTFVTSTEWTKSLSKYWPHAPLVGGYRVLVFTNEDLPILKIKYKDFTFQALGLEKTLGAIEEGLIGPFLCNLEETKKLIEVLNPIEEEI